MKLELLLQGTFTGKLGTINKYIIPHVVSIWYTLDEEDNIIFNTGKNFSESKKYATEQSNQ